MRSATTFVGPTGLGRVGRLVARGMVEGSNDGGVHAHVAGSSPALLAALHAHPTRRSTGRTGGHQVGGYPLVVGASPCCWAMMAASTTCRSEGSIANGPPATGTCQTWVIIGVEPSWYEPGAQGVNPSI